MAEIDAKREARRRRILENSESRLRKITKRNPESIKDNYKRVEDDNLEVRSNLEEYDIRNGICSAVSEKELQDYRRLDEDRHDSLPSDLDDSEKRVSEPVSRVEFMLCTLLFSRINFVLLAIVVNILLLLKLDNLFGQTIIIPYSLLMLGRLYSCNRFHVVQDGSLLITALILCNIKPKLIYKFKTSLTLLIFLLDDFGLYMFSFVLIRYVVVCYYQ
ncbi:hypothetical protein DMN91_001666 [Ooceraea biroi]|uniref:Uncharacterized protein n=1 Tax=Ooceraea biroi TaxID=2015173 RepID=A0A026WYA1_OOCBI|nr:uncharacterized protein LOC105287917 [Ooceraea biroi]EZA60721.1 hypothetical protein X777_13961 [Ooceraea biroi]RLU25510.1 hypothetical protein DMN91_001666 [Ooceraea biroi]